MTHIIKLRKDFEQPILNGTKNFEIRKNDRGYQKGDLVQFLVVDEAQVYMDGNLVPEASELNDKWFEITYVLSGWGLQEGYVAFGIKEVYPI